jgi:hypothetical protein
MSQNEPLWRGDLVIDQSKEENERKCCEIKVTISSLEVSKNNQTTFNWGSGKKYDFLSFFLFTLFPRHSSCSTKNISKMCSEENR